MRRVPGVVAFDRMFDAQPVRVTRSLRASGSLELNGEGAPRLTWEFCDNAGQTRNWMLIDTKTLKY